MKRALVFNAERRVGLVLCREFARKGFIVDMASHALLPRSFYSKYCCKKIRYTMDVLDPLVDYIKKMKPDIIVPLSEDSYLVAYELIDREIQGIIPLPSRDLFVTMRNKEIAMRLLQSHGLRVPLTYSADEFMSNRQHLKNSKGKNKFLIKPRISHSGKGIMMFKSLDDFEYAYSAYLKQNKVGNREFLGCHLEHPIIQEYIEGENYSLHMIIHNERLYLKQLMHHVRYFPKDFGLPIRSRTVELEDPQLDKIIEFFITIKWSGYIQCDLIRRSDGCYFINEVNPRFSGVIENVILSGIDVVNILLALKENRVLPVAVPTNYDYEYRSLFGELAYLSKADHKIATLYDLIRKEERKIYYDINTGDIIPHIIHLIRLLLVKEVI